MNYKYFGFLIMRYLLTFFSLVVSSPLRYLTLPCQTFTRKSSHTISPQKTCDKFLCFTNNAATTEKCRNMILLLIRQSFKLFQYEDNTEGFSI